MSEPTYRVEISHHPANGSALRYVATVSLYRDPDALFADFGGETREEAFDKAQDYCRRYSTLPEESRTVYLSEDGDILDPHEVQR